MALSKENEYFLSVLSAFVSKKQAPPLPQMNLPLFLNIAKNSQLKGVVGYMLQDTPFEEWDPKQDFYSTLFYLTRAGEHIRVIREDLKKAGIVHGILKGVTLARLYPVPELRSFGDLDVIIQPKDVPLLKEMLQNGYHIVYEKEDEIVAVKNGLLIEFHLSLLYDKGVETPQLDRYLSDAFSHLTLGEDGYYSFDPLFHFVYLLSHQMRHFRTSSPGIRSYMDLAVFLQAGLIQDEKKLTATLQQTGLYDYACVALALTAYWFDVKSPLPVEITAQQAEEVAAYLLAAGQFAGAENPRARHMEQAVGKRFPRLYIFWRSLFPSVQGMKEDERYNRYWLPFAYVYRLVHGVFCRSQYVATAVKELTTAQEDACRRVRVHEILQVKEQEA